MLINQAFFINNLRGVDTLLRIDILSASASTFSFVIVCILITALFYSLIKLRKKNKLIAAQNEEILLKNIQLKEQNKKLKKINTEKSNLIGIVSHDLKSPFNRIFALVNLLKLTNKDISKDNQEYLSKMHLVIKDGLALIRNLLDIRAIEDEGIKMTFEEIDVVRLVKDSLKAHRPLADIKQVKLKFTSDIDTLLITSDKLYLSRILENLLSNALKFSEQDTIIHTQIGTDDTGKFLLKITDQGPGISEEDMKLLFQKYQILSARPTDGESSTGLGLSIVKLLVGKLGGEVFCTSEVGNGSTFIIKMPLVIQEND